MCHKMLLYVIFIGILTASLAFQPTEENLPPKPKGGRVDTHVCELYPPQNGTNREPCQSITQDKSSHCYILWHFNNVTNTSTVYYKGCFIDTVSCYDRNYSCSLHDFKLTLVHCCCEGDMCNENKTFPGISSLYSRKSGSTNNLIEEAINHPETQEDSSAIIAFTVTPIFLLLAALIACYFLYRKHKGSPFDELANGETSLSRPPSTAGGMENEGVALVSQVTLCEVRARGRFGAVWRAKLGQRDVAVKVFPLQDKQSWLAEQEIYRLPRMDHPDILHFIGVDKKGDNLQAEYWLITAYHDKGSLCDYLKAHTLTWPEAWRVAVCVARGLAHLHGESGGKPAVAHRDFKSKNVLLKADLSACIADFGLALVFVSGRGCGDAHGQVGTRRYMAPEVLDGAINFTKDAFLRIDMYACALVLWEIISRCEETNLEPNAQYRLPLEEEVGSHPSLEEMQEAVVQQKMRPQIPGHWRDHQSLAVLSDTIEECWDHDAEARLSASCVLERVVSQRPPAAPATPSAPVYSLQDTIPLLIHELNEVRPDRAC